VSWFTVAAAAASCCCCSCEGDCAMCIATATTTPHHNSKLGAGLSAAVGSDLSFPYTQ
jgi:hypothetical protein